MASMAAVGAAMAAVVLVSTGLAHVCIWSLCGIMGF
jgi:hypothetical protein